MENDENTQKYFKIIIKKENHLWSVYNLIYDENDHDLIDHTDTIAVGQSKNQANKIAKMLNDQLTSIGYISKRSK